MARRFPTESMDRFIDLIWGGPPAQPAMTLTLELSGTIDLPRMKRSLRLLAGSIPLLRRRFVDHWWRPYWEERPGDPAEGMIAVRPPGDREGRLRELLREPLDPGIRLIVWRGASDAIGLKFDHRFGDYRAFVEFANRLADLYNRLCEDPDHVPPPTAESPRGIGQLTRSLPLRRKLALLRSFSRTARAFRSSGHWRLPAPPGRGGEFTYAHHSLDPDRVAELEDFAADRGATPFQVLLAAYFLAMTEAMPDSDETLAILVPVDLRRFLPEPEPFRWCNLVGSMAIFLRNLPESPLDSVVEEIRRQMFDLRRDGAGLATPRVVLNLLPGGSIFGLTPFAFSRRSRRAGVERLARSRDRKMLYASPGGDLGTGRLRFGDAAVRRAFGCPGELRIPGYNGLGVDGFAGSLTIWCGCGPEEQMRRILRRMREILSPVFSVPLDPGSTSGLSG